MIKLPKTIKYISIAFALLLIVLIATLLINTGDIFFTSIGLIQNNNITEEPFTISNNTDTFSSFEIKLETTSLEIKEGISYKVETNNKKIKYINQNGTIKIEEPKIKKLFNKAKNISDLTIYIPKEVNLESLNIESNIGIIKLDSIKLQKLYINSGIGGAELNNTNIINNTTIKNGIGNLIIEKSILNNLNLDLGVGDTKINSELIGNTKINSGLGELTLNNIDNNYKIKLNKGLGEVKYNNKPVKDKEIVGTGRNYIEINAGIGNININA